MLAGPSLQGVSGTRDIPCRFDALVAIEPIARAERGLQCLVEAPETAWPDIVGFYRFDKGELDSIGVLNEVDCDTGMFFCSVYGTETCLTIDFQTSSRQVEDLRYFDAAVGCGAPSPYEATDFAVRLEGAWRTGDDDWFVDEAGLFEHLSSTNVRSDVLASSGPCEIPGDASDRHVCPMAMNSVDIFVLVLERNEEFSVIGFWGVDG